MHRRVRPESSPAASQPPSGAAPTRPPEAARLARRRQTSNRFGTHLLPMASRGAPRTRSTPPARGHPGAWRPCSRRFFKESFTIPGPVQASDDGFALVPYAGRLRSATNRQARVERRARPRHAGVHWPRTAPMASAGEKVAIHLLRDYNTATTRFADSRSRSSTARPSPYNSSPNGSGANSGDGAHEFSPRLTSCTSTTSHACVTRK